MPALLATNGGDDALLQYSWLVYPSQDTNCPEKERRDDNEDEEQACACPISVSPTYDAGTRQCCEKRRSAQAAFARAVESVLALRWDLQPRLQALRTWKATS